MSASYGEKTFDYFNIPVQGVVALALDTLWTPPIAGGFSRGHAIIATVAGNMSAVLADGSTFVFPVAAGLTVVPFDVRKINSAGTTATATFSVLL